MRRNVDMLSGSITKGLLAMTMPIMIMNVMQSLFSIFDMIVLKIFSTGSAVGAVGASGPLITLFTSLLIGIAAGANIVIAKRIGMGDSKRVDQAVMTALAVAVAGGLFLMIAGACFSKTLLGWTNCPNELIEQAALYFRIYFYGIPMLMIYNFCAAILRAAGDTKTPMYLLILGGIIKLMFTFLLLSVFKMDVAGVALSTLISNSVICVLAVIALFKNRSFHIDLKKPSFSKGELCEMLYIGIPSGLQAAVYSLANVIILSAVNSFGPDATTGISIANQFDGLMYHIIYAPSLAATPYVAQNIGAGNIDRMKRAISRAVLITVAFGVTFGSLSAIFSGQLSSLMSNSPEVIAYSRQKMVIVSSLYFLCGINEILSGVLKGMKRPFVPAISSLVFMCLIRFVWVYAVFPHYRNLSFLYLIWPIGWILSIITLVIFFFITLPKISRSDMLTDSKPS